MINYPTFTFFREFLHLEIYEQLESHVYSDQIIWHFRHGTLDSTEYSVEDGESQFDCYTWGNVVYHEHKDDIANLDDAWKPLLHLIQEQFGSKVFRIQLNMYTNQNKRIYTKPHYDVGSLRGMNVPHEKYEIIILNFTNCNGGTQIVDVEIPSFKNGAVHFSNMYPHNGILQTDRTRRICANIVIYPKGKPL